MSDLTARPDVSYLPGGLCCCSVTHISFLVITENVEMLCLGFVFDIKVEVILPSVEKCSDLRCWSAAMFVIGDVFYVLYKSVNSATRSILEASERL